MSRWTLIYRPSSPIGFSCSSCVLNLMLNALEALEPVSGRVKQLSVDRGGPRPDSLVIQISDNGIGLDDPVAAFEPFVTTKPEGMGLGSGDLPVDRRGS